MNFINEYNILISNQTEFIRDHNISDALLEFLENAYGAMNKNKVFLAVFLDFPKAFDTVDHGTLLHKLKFYGFRGKSIQWLSSFLSNRTQFVELGNKRSSLCKNNITVPERFTHGPILCLIYINYFYKYLSNQM